MKTTCDKFLLCEGPEKNISLNSKLRVYDNLKVFKHYLGFLSNIFQRWSNLEVLGWNLSLSFTK